MAEEVHCEGSRILVVVVDSVVVVVNGEVVVVDSAVAEIK